MRRLTPSNCQELLFDDVIWTRKARQEHDAFVDLMRDEYGVHVMRVHELLKEVVDDPEGRAYVLDRKLTANEVGAGGVGVLRPWMNEMESTQLVAHLIGGLTVDELPGEAVGAIMGARGELSEDEQFSTAWLVTHEILTLEQYQQVAPQITAGGVQFTIESLGYADHVGMVTRLQVIVEMRGPMAQVLYYRDLTSLGAVYPIREGEAEYGFGGQRG